MSFRVASRGSGRASSRAGFEGSGGAGSMAMSISGSRSASSARGGWWVEGGEEAEAEGGLGLEVGLGEAMVGGRWGGASGGVYLKTWQGLLFLVWDGGYLKRFFGIFGWTGSDWLSLSALWMGCQESVLHVDAH